MESLIGDWERGPGGAIVEKVVEIPFSRENFNSINLFSDDGVRASQDGEQVRSFHFQLSGWLCNKFLIDPFAVVRVVLPTLDYSSADVLVIKVFVMIRKVLDG